MTITNGYLTADEAVSYIGRSEARPTDELEDVITSVSRMVDQYCGREFFTTPAQARVFDSSDGYGVHFGEFNDLISATTIKTDEDGDGVFEKTWSASTYQLLDQKFEVPNGGPFGAVVALSGNTFPVFVPSGRVGLVEVTGTWGYASTVPAEVKQAAKILVAEVAKLADAPLGVAGFGEFGVVRVSKYMPARARQLLDPYRHPANFGLA